MQYTVRVLLHHPKPFTVSRQVTISLSIFSKSTKIRQYLENILINAVTCSWGIVQSHQATDI